MNDSRSEAQLFLGDNEHSDSDLPQGRVCVRSLRSPDKDTANEDAAAVIPVARDILVLAVADGVGGTPSGKEASAAAVRSLRRRLGREEIGPDQLRAAILDALDEANRSILALGRGAATTLVIGEIVKSRLRSYHVGDSELISVGQRGRVKLRVVPHSPTGFAIEAGLLDADEAVSHDQRHVLFNVIGTPDMRVEIGAPVSVAVRDTVLLASDGLLDNLFADEIIEIIRVGPLERAADRLVELARQRMRGSEQDGPSKPDDLTVVLYRPKRAVKPKRSG